MLPALLTLLLGRAAFASDEPTLVGPAFMLVDPEHATPAPPVVRDDKVIMVTGHGLTFVLVTPATVTNLRGTLVVARLSGDEAVVQALVTPGTKPAEGAAPASVDPGEWASRKAWGAGGPAIATPKGAPAMESVFLGVTTQASMPGDWLIVGPGLWLMALPEGTTVMSVPTDDNSPFEVHLGTNQDDLVAFQGPFRKKKATSVDAFRFDGATETARGTVERADGLAPVPWIELAYVHGGERWRQRGYLLPDGKRAVLAMKAQAREANAAAMFALSDVMVASYFARKD